MVAVGIVLIVLGWLIGSPFLWSLGSIALVIGLVLMLLGALGHAIGGRRHYY